MPETQDLIAQIRSLTDRLTAVEDRDAIERLQNQYGFYLDNRMWDEVAELFTEDAPSMEIGRRGNYVGKDRMKHFLREVLGGGRWGLLRDEIINHIQLQMVTTLSDDGLSAQMRSRALVQGNSPPGSGKMLLAEGVYENEFVKENGIWKIKRLWWIPTYYFMVDGFDQAIFDSGPEDANFPPDSASAPIDEGLGRRFPPFHYLHPFTGNRVPAPSANRDE